MDNTVRIRRSRRAPKVIKVSTTRLSSTVSRADTSRQIQNTDEFTSLVNENTIIIPPYDPAFLAKCVERSNMVGQCIAALVTNVALCGQTVAPVREDLKIDEDEKDELLSFIEAANADESLTTVHAKIVNDYETFGYAYLEAVRDRIARLSLLRHAQVPTMRMTAKSADLVAVQYEVRRGRRSSVVTEYKSFRKFVQIVGGKVRYFKEFGDPRPMDYRTGLYGGVSEEYAATEIIHFKQHSDDPYGVPRWINQLVSVLGSREAEECNLRYFEDNTVPPAVLTIAGGRLTAASHRDLKNALNAQKIGKERQNQILLLEAVPERESLDDKGQVTIRLDKLSDARQGDGLFKAYDEGNQAKVRSSFRLPPVAVGMSQDVTFATANVSAFIAESQVYAPLRAVFDEVYNKRLISSDLGLGLRTCKLVSQVPFISNSETLIKSLTALNVMGALTPRMANEAANKLLQIDIPQYPKPGEEGHEEWMDKPIIFVTKGTASQDGQAQKTESIKDIEDGGDVGTKQPEHGQE